MKSVHDRLLLIAATLTAAILHADGMAIAGIEKPANLSLTKWKPYPAGFAGAEIADGSVVLRSGQWKGPEPKPGRWACLDSPALHDHVAVRTTVTIRRPARQFGYFGQSWSVWPDPLFGDQGFEAAVLVRVGRPDAAGTERGYRVQLSHKYQQVALVKYPDGGYLRSVPCEIHLQQPHRVEVTARGTEVVVTVDGQERIRLHDHLLPLESGRVGLGVGSLAKVHFGDVEVETLSAAPTPDPRPHVPHFSVREWLGGRPWVFDGDEPILLLPVQEQKSQTYFTQTLNNAKLRPGYKPLLSWNGHWDIAGQGAWPEGGSRSTEPEVNGGGRSLTATWSAHQHADRFETRTRLTVGWNEGRGSYTYDVDSTLEVLPGEPFHIRSFDFEHHTPLDPFGWKYLVVRREDGGLYHRPVYPIDPGLIDGVESYRGLRMWYGRHYEPLLIAPAVEYEVDPAWNLNPATGEPADRRLSTAVCAAFYDTGVTFGQETLAAGTKVRVKYRYTGYPADEAEAIFRASRLYESPRLDPEHYYIFADEWPKLTFSKFKAMSEPWWNARLPFMTGHNQRPSYELAKNIGVGSGFAMRLGAGAYGKADLPIPPPLPAGRYALQVLCRSVNPHGPGGRIELTASDTESQQPLLEVTHYLGNESFDWKTVGFAFELPRDASRLSIAFGNAGTGEVLFTDAEFRRLELDSALPSGILPAANMEPPSFAPAPEGALADYRMEEASGHHVFDYAGGPFGMLELANLDWVTDEGRTAVRFADNSRENTSGRPAYPRAGAIESGYFSHEAYAGRQAVPVAIAGHHGGGFEVRGLTITTWIKPAPAMGAGEHGGKGDVIGVGARQFILSLYGQQSPYKLGARLNVNDEFLAEGVELSADRWHHVAMTCQAEDGMWRVRLFVNGRPVHEGRTQKFAAPAVIPPSIVLGSELFYLHDAYYRGLIGRTLVFDRALTAEEVARLAKPHQLP